MLDVNSSSGCFFVHRRIRPLLVYCLVLLDTPELNFFPKALAFWVWLNRPPEARRVGYWDRPSQRGRVPVDNIVIVVIILFFWAHSIYTNFFSKNFFRLRRAKNWILSTQTFCQKNNFTSYFVRYNNACAVKHGQERTHSKNRFIYKRLWGHAP